MKLYKVTIELEGYVTARDEEEAQEKFYESKYVSNNLELQDMITIKEIEEAQELCGEENEKEILD
jgi:hypothetical protein